MRTNDCDCVILCGGLGKRLQSVVHDVPKVMAQVDGQPFLDFVIEYLRTQKIVRIILCTGYKTNLIEEYYRAHNFGLTIDFSKENEPLGTGGAVKNARDIIVSDVFFVLNGDSFLSADLQTFLDFHKEKGSLASMLVSKMSEGRDFGNLRLDDDNRIIDFQEKIDDANHYLVNAGIYCFEQTIFSRMPEVETFSLEKDLFPKLVGDQFYGYRVNQEFVDIGTPERYNLALQKLKKRKTLGD